MKGKTFFSILVSLILIGIASFSFYQQKEEERMLEFEGYEISVIEERVDALYNEEKTDIVESISEDELEELDEIFTELKDKDLAERNQDRIRDMELDFLVAREMFGIEEQVLDLFDDEVVTRSVNMRDVTRVEEEVEGFDFKTEFYNRNMALIEEAKEQLEAIEEAETFIEALFDEDGDLRSDITQDEIDEALALIDEIKNDEIKSRLTAQIEGEEIEIEELEEEEEDIEEDEVEDEQEEAEWEPEPTPTPTTPSRPSGSTGSGNSSGGSSSGTGSNNQSGSGQGTTEDSNQESNNNGSQNNNNNTNDGEDTDSGNTDAEEDTDSEVDTEDGTDTDTGGDSGTDSEPEPEPTPEPTPEGTEE